MSDDKQEVSEERDIETGGGTYIEGGADTDGGDIVGGDKFEFTLPPAVLKVGGGLVVAVLALVIITAILQATKVVQTWFPMPIPSPALVSPTPPTSTPMPSPTTPTTTPPTSTPMPTATTPPTPSPPTPTNTPVPPTDTPVPPTDTPVPPTNTPTPPPPPTPMPWGQEPIYKESEQDETYTNKGNKMYTVALEKRITAQAIALANRTRPYDIAETQVLTIPYGSTDPITLTRTEEGYYGYDSGVGRLTVKYPSYMAPDSYNTIYVQVDVPRELGLPMPNEHVYTSVPVDGIPLPVDPSSSERSTYTDTILVGGTMSVTLIGFNFCPDKQDGICDSETKKTRIYEYDQPTKWALNFQAPSREGTYESHIKIYPYAEHSDTPQWEGFVLILVANAQPTPTSKP